MRLHLLACGLLLAVSACSETPSTATAEPPADSQPRQVAASDVTAEIPALDLATVDGARYVLADHRGRWVVVNFWATWCSPCLKEMPELSELHERRDDIEVVGLAYEEIEAADMQAFLQGRPVAYPVAIIDTFAPPADFATPRGLPMTYLIAPDGRVAKKFLGPVTAREIEDAVAAGGQPSA
ncbi:thioredoxin [Pseudoxanthomonas kalamensis DSM 18571]|uniref:TlpA family protein disulfide reductase n=1 Tax=Pseudoxanthomonas kalamensis TaxID=289483 RepID=UPI001391D7B8|nr:thioredoxin [Pseudoxanthomonas kalamensis DSM 18571]